MTFDQHLDKNVQVAKLQEENDLLYNTMLYCLAEMVKASQKPHPADGMTMLKTTVIDMIQRLGRKTSE